MKMFHNWVASYRYTREICTTHVLLTEALAVTIVVSKAERIHLTKTASFHRLPGMPNYDILIVDAAVGQILSGLSAL